MFNRQPTLTDGIFTASPLRACDEEPLRRAASDPLIWEGHPASDRYQPAVFAGYFAFLLSTKSTLVFTHNGATCGCSAYYTAPDQPGTISIGFTFLTRNHWGGPANRAIKSLMLDHAFASYDAVWLHVAPTNIRSQKATQKLGAVYTHTHVTDSGLGPTAMQYYRLDRSAWRDRIGQ